MNGRFGSRQDALDAAVAAGRRVTVPSYAWQCPTMHVGPALYELRQLTPGFYAWVLA